MGSGSPTSGVSHSVPSGARKSNISSGSTSLIVASVDSYEPSVSCSVTNIDRMTSRLSSGSHGAGSWRSTRYSNGALIQRSEATVDAPGVGLEDGAIGRAQQRHRTLRLRAEPVDANLAIERQGARAHQRRQLTGRTPAGEIHLEEAILGVNEPGAARHVLARGAAHGRNPERVPCHGDGRRKPADLVFSVELREAGAELRADPHPGYTESNDQDDDHDEESACETTAHNEAGPRGQGSGLRGLRPETALRPEA